MAVGTGTVPDVHAQLANFPRQTVSVTCEWKIDNGLCIILLPPQKPWILFATDLNVYIIFYTFQIVETCKDT